MSSEVQLTGPKYLLIHYSYPIYCETWGVVQVHQVSQNYLYAHHQLLDEFRNATHWPKHLLVQYSWQAEQEVDALSGLYVVFAICKFAPPSTNCGLADQVVICLIWTRLLANSPP